jgi:putative addiction module component (TIGR02574 family)
VNPDFSKKTGVLENTGIRSRIFAFPETAGTSAGGSRSRQREVKVAWYDAAMSDGTIRILSHALRLSIAERAELATALLASLDGEPDNEIESIWATEIESRAARVRSGKAQVRPWNEIRPRTGLGW